ncbi:MAG: hypothetical protein V3V09_07365, partial [Arenicellales bacterium]
MTVSIEQSDSGDIRTDKLRAWYAEYSALTAQVNAKSSLKQVADIAAMQAYPAANGIDYDMVFRVVDASADANVTSGAAMFFYDHATTTFTFTSALEDMNLVVEQADVVGLTTSLADKATLAQLALKLDASTPLPTSTGTQPAFGQEVGAANNSVTALARGGLGMSKVNLGNDAGLNNSGASQTVVGVNAGRDNEGNYQT